MKKKLILLLVLFGSLIFTGCFNNKKDIVAIFKNKVNKLDSYHLSGELEIINNEDKHLYEVDVSYKKDNNFRVSLKNKTNDHEQIILKNNSGVYVLTPSLNKSFKFQSEWPENNSQSYLLQNLLTDIERDKTKKIENKDNQYIITTKVNYPNNKILVKQKIYLDKKGNVKKVEVINKDGIIKITMKYKKMDLNANFDKNYFKLNENIKTSKGTTQTIKEIDDAIYPMYVPENTYLESEETVKTDDGERVILTFGGENPFMIIGETVKPEEQNITIPVYGEPTIISDTVGTLTNNSASWYSNGVEYYAVFETLDNSKLLEVVNSITTVPVGK